LSDEAGADGGEGVGVFLAQGATQPWQGFLEQADFVAAALAAGSMALDAACAAGLKMAVGVEQEPGRRWMAAAAKPV